MRRFLSRGLLLVLLAAIPVQAQTNRDPTLRVVTKPFAPFVFEQNHQYVGFSIDLWRHVANELGVKYEIIGKKTVPELLQAVEHGEADVGVAGISITAEREATIDFSHPFFGSGLQILVAVEPNTSIRSFLSFLISPTLFQVLGILLLVILIAAHALWFFERRHNPEMFPKDYGPGIWEACWWAVVTVITVGYGDKTPKTVPGRLVAMVWMFSGIVLISYFTASVSSVLTVQRLSSNITGPSDLMGKRVATVRGSTAADYLHTRPILVEEFDKIEDAYTALQEHEVSAVVYDAPVLLYYTAHDGQGKFQVVGSMFQKQNYGIVLQNNSPYREKINRALLTLQENGTYAELRKKWFGQADE